MLKIYRAYNFHGDIKLEDYIEFKYGIYDTGIKGFGIVNSGIVNKKINYEWTSLDCFENYVNNVKIKGGIIQDFKLYNPMDYNDVFNKGKEIPKDNELYNHFYGEEAIILFTQFVNLKYVNDKLIKKIFDSGYGKGHAMYILKPNASFDMYPIPTTNVDEYENFEVLQSNNLGKRLVLQKMNRKI